MDDLIQPIPNPNLISKASGSTKILVDYSFISNSSNPAYSCIVCRQEAIFRLMPKSGVYDTAYLEDYGFVCQHCTQHLDSSVYALRHVSKL